MSESAIGVKTLAGIAGFIGVISILDLFLQYLAGMRVIITLTDIIPPINYELIRIYLGFFYIISAMGLIKLRKFGWIIGLIISPIAIIISIIVKNWLMVNVYLLFWLYLLPKPIRNVFKNSEKIIR